MFFVNRYSTRPLVDTGVFPAVYVRNAGIVSPEKSTFDQYRVKVKITFDITPAIYGE
ncbi:MAG: hypothetical protein HUU43_02005 [Ignavibacteriaceae bacterium]|nr:hypothetical protein [Ignavibacteriaceae bacterium]